MKPPLFALLCAAATLAGWGCAALWPESEASVVRKTPAMLPAATARTALLGGKASPRVPSTADALALARSLDPADPESLAKLKALPPGNARDLALALFLTRAARRPDGGGGEPKEFNPFADVPAGAKPSTNGMAMENVARCLLAGEPLEEFADLPFGAERDPFARSGTLLDGIIKNWAGLDPAAASETILKMPSGKSRTAAVDAAAKVMARDNPQAAWDLVVKSGEQKLGEGAARAWLARMAKQDSFNTNPTAGLSPAQQQNMAVALSDLLAKDDGLQNGELSEMELSMLSLGAPFLAPGPAQEKVLAVLAELNPMGLLFATGGANIFLPDYPAHALSHARLLEEKALADPVSVLATLTTAGPETDISAVSPAVLNAAAPRLLPQLAKSGHLAEAVQVLQRVTDSRARREALENLLPQWMDADPAAARAAFNAAPFTALERERWQRHPAFLLNPEH